MIGKNGFCWLVLMTVLTGCASTGNPSGGPKDVTPPVLTGTIPLENALNYDKKRVEISFDELIALKNPSEKVLVSPPQKLPPVVKTVGNKAVVVLSDSLRPNTTYSIDFTDAIVDYNEGNKYGDYAFSFSTGASLDSFRVSGCVIDAATLNPVSGMLIGSYGQPDDNLFRLTPFERVTKSRKDGCFSLKGLSAGAAYVYALTDKNRDYRFDQPTEPIAFQEGALHPTIEPGVRSDTLWRDSLTVDTIKAVPIRCYKPDNLVLRSFTENKGRQYVAKKERSPRHRISIILARKSDALPELTLLDFPGKSNWGIPEVNATKDTLQYWITDSSIIATDTLRFKLDYMKTDSLFRLQPSSDTLMFVSRTRKVRASSETKPTEPVAIPVSHLRIKDELNSTLEVYATPRFEMEEPIAHVQGTPWHLYVKKDTVWEQTPFAFERDTARLRTYLLRAKWQFDTEYKFELDSGMIQSVYGKTNDNMSQTFVVRAEEEYSRLTATITGLSTTGFAELVNKSDEVVRRVRLESGKADFTYLAPGTYYLRAVDDLNANFQWDTGDLSKRLQPENVYYDHRPLNLRSNWDVEEVWDVHELPLLEQKPKELYPKDKSNER
jgi:hypothetical protein